MNLVENLDEYEAEEFITQLKETLTSKYQEISLSKKEIEYVI